MLDALTYVCGALVIFGALWLGYLGVSGRLKSQQRLGSRLLFGTLFFVLAWTFLYTQKHNWEKPETTQAGQTQDAADSSSKPKEPRPEATPAVINSNNQANTYIRAHVVISGAGMEKPLRAGTPRVGCGFRLVNNGKTTARNAAIRYRVIVNPTEPSAEERVLPPIPGSNPDKFEIAPGAMKPVEFPVTLDDQKLNLIEKGFTKLYIFGFVEYDDDSNAHHRTDFCLVYLPGTTKFEHCAAGNNAP